MKIRINNSSLRYRLTRPEVERFAIDGIIIETVNIGIETLTYILQSQPVDQLSATFKNNVITLTVPQKLAKIWTNTENVGFDNQGGTGLYLLVEKDFKCLDNVTEDQSDNYPNPLAKNKE
jgi:hypothetical protein